MLHRFQRSVNDLSPLAIRRYFAQLLERMKPISAHKHFRTLRTFFRWCLEADLLHDDPMRGFSMKAPRTLPRVPEDDEVRRLLAACGDDFTGRRNRALISLLADSALRISEALRLRIEDLNFAARTIVVHGKGQTDGVGFFGAETARCLRAWLARRSEVHTEDPIFVDRLGRGLTQWSATHTLHRLSRRARLPRLIGPHMLRHYAPTSILRATGDLELVRQVLRHSTLAMTLRYAPDSDGREP